MDPCWATVFWTSFFLGCFVIPFMQQYWMAGHFSRKSRAKYACWELFKRGFIVLVLFGILLWAGVQFLKTPFFLTAEVSVLLMSNLYGMIVLVLLMSYGITFLPFMLWQKMDAKSLLYKALADADEIYRSYRDARLDYHKEVSICQNLIKDNTTGFNQQLMEVL